MTAQVKAELASTAVTKTCCRKAEVSSMLRFADALHLVNGGIVVEAELDTGAAARRLRKDIAEVFGHDSEVVMLKGNGLRRGHPLHRPGLPRGRVAGPADRADRPAQPPGARAAAAGGLGLRLRRGRRLAWRLPGARLADRARAVLARSR